MDKIQYLNVSQLHIFYLPYEEEGLSIREIADLEHYLGRKLLAYGLRVLYSYNLTIEELEEQLEHGANGKPYLGKWPQICFNITHCDGLAACVFCQTPVGIDAEYPGYFAQVLIKKALTEEEQRYLLKKSISEELRNEFFIRFWTLKEAYVKMTGTGVDVNLTDFSFSFSGTSEPYEVTCSDRSVSCYHCKLPGGHILSVCRALD